MTPKSRAIIATSSALLSAALVALIFNHSEDQTTETNKQSINLPADQVLTFDCEIPVNKPDSLTLTCASGGMLVSDIRWSNWSAQGAQGSGIYVENNCDPDCASGTYSKTQVNITLNNLLEIESKFYLKDLVSEAINGKTFPNGEVAFRWDLTEFFTEIGSK